MSRIAEKAIYPSFIIGGAAKSGTTSLSRYLATQPGIHLPEKEPNYFTYLDKEPAYRIENHPFVRDQETYFRLLNPGNPDSEEIRVGEKSVSYLYEGYFNRVIQNIKNTHPWPGDLKWIFILRHPVERAYSQFIHNRNFHEDLPFREAIRRWPERKEKGWIPAYDYLGSGRYSKALEAYQRNFTHVKVYLFEDLKERTQWLLNDLLHFLESHRPLQMIPFKRHNKSGIPSNKIYETAYRLFGNGSPVGSVFKALIPSSLRQKLKQVTHHKPALSATYRYELTSYYEQEIRSLEKLIDRDLSHWYDSR